MKNDKLHEEADTNLLSGSMLSVIVFVLAVTFRVNVWELYLFSLIPVFSGAALAFIRKDLRLVYLSTVFIIISTWVLTMKALDFSTYPQFLAHIMSSLGGFRWRLTSIFTWQPYSSTPPCCSPGR
jgi:hypothetical protein